MFSEVSSTTKKNLTMVTKLLKHRALEMVKGEKKKPPALPPRDQNLEDIDDSMYSGSMASEFEKRLVEKMYYNNTSPQYEEENVPLVESKNTHSYDSRHMGTGNFGNNLQISDDKSNKTR